MAEHAEGFTFKVGDGASPETFTAMALLEVPEVFSGARGTFPTRTTESTGNTKEYALGLEEGDEYSLVCHRDFANAQQDRLRAAHVASTDAATRVNLQFIFTDGSVTETNAAEFLVTSMPVATADPNGDGEFTKQTFNVKRVSDWTTSEA